MRIYAEDTGLHRLAQNSPMHRGNMGNQSPAHSASADSAKFSQFKGKLRFDSAAMADWDTRVTSSGDEKAFQLMDKSISSIGNIMERMKALAELAGDESLSDEDRITIQIDLVKLNKELNMEKQKMSMRMAGQAEQEIAKNLEGLEESASALIEMLERARARVQNGGEWDAAEIYQPAYKISSIEAQTPNGRYFFEMSGDEFVLPGDIDPDTAIIVRHLAPDGGSMTVTNDPDVPKLSMILNDSNVPMVMDPDSAKETSQKIAAQLKDLREMKEKLASAVNETRVEGFAATQQGVLQSLQLQQSAHGNGEDSNRQQKEETVQTSIGEMVYNNGDRSNPTLRNALDKTGQMFARLEKFFAEKLGNFSGKVIRNDRGYLASFASAKPIIT